MAFCLYILPWNVPQQNMQCDVCPHFHTWPLLPLHKELIKCDNQVCNNQKHIDMIEQQQHSYTVSLKMAKGMLDIKAHHPRIITLDGIYE